MHHTVGKPEQTIARAVLKRILAAGYSVAVFDGEEQHPTTSVEQAVWDNMGETDMDRLKVFDRELNQRVGSILLIYCNGEDLVSDWSWNQDYPESEAIIGRLAEGA